MVAPPFKNMKVIGGQRPISSVGKQQILKPSPRFSWFILVLYHVISPHDWGNDRNDLQKYASIHIYWFIHLFRSSQSSAPALSQAPQCYTGRHFRTSSSTPWPGWYASGELISPDSMAGEVTIGLWCVNLSEQIRGKPMKTRNSICFVHHYPILPPKNDCSWGYAPFFRQTMRCPHGHSRCRFQFTQL